MTKELNDDKLGFFLDNPKDIDFRIESKSEKKLMKEKEPDKDLVERADQVFRKWDKERREPFKFPNLRIEIARFAQREYDKKLEAEQKLGDELVKDNKKTTKQIFKVCDSAYKLEKSVDKFIKENEAFWEDEDIVELRKAVTAHRKARGK